MERNSKACGVREEEGNAGVPAHVAALIHSSALLSMIGLPSVDSLSHIVQSEALGKEK